MLERQICPVCGQGPWVSPLNHASRKHAINRHVMRDICGLSTNDKVTEESAREAWRANGRAKSDTLRRNADQVRGKRGRTQRRTRAFERSLQNSGLMRWLDEHPEEAAAMRAEFRSRMESPEAQAKWAASMARVRAEREYTDEERAAFRARMQDPEIERKRRVRRESVRTLVCKVDGCERPHVAKGLCKMHWSRSQRSGDVGPAEALTRSEAGQRGGHLRALTDEQMESVRRACAAGQSQRAVAERFGVTQSIVSRVVRGDYKSP
jgi:hypothetical protein